MPLVVSQFNIVGFPHCPELENSKKEQLCLEQQSFKSQKELHVPLFDIRGNWDAYKNMF